MTPKQPATGPWMSIGTFDIEPDALYLVQGVFRISLKRGRSIENDHMAAALVIVSGVYDVRAILEEARND